jgi:hypothetical protein
MPQRIDPMDRPIDLTYGDARVFPSRGTEAICGRPVSRAAGLRSVASWRRTMHGEWIRDGVGLVAYAEAFGWFAHPFGGGPPLGPFADENAAKSALEREEETEAQR